MENAFDGRDDSSHDDYEAPEIMSVESLSGKLGGGPSGDEQPWGGL